ncbi:Hpt domain-containing protein [Methylobrevis pamukkalensis]|uniref:Hpt domain protein n=1 Tax=Methylobrevis pamukkalensis TaxID=1439726 RepID=A0A1E3H6U5_9HYPH|nr:Hpt domain-containing protein [Methylobrevis pamukkalensis]ODN72024.1 Hpt domain protein [Methylobrevis pamukkalensis]
MAKAASTAAADTGERIPAVVDLRKKCREMPTRAPGDDPVARAEAAMQKLSGSFRIWIEDEIEMLEAAWTKVGETGMQDDEAREAFYRRVHDIKGQGATLGFPLAATVAASLCALFEELPAGQAIPEMLINQHVDAMRAIVREDARDESNRIGAALASRLTDVTREFITAAQSRA